MVCENVGKGTEEIKGANKSCMNSRERLRNILAYNKEANISNEDGALRTLRHTGGNSFHVVVDFARRRAKNKRTNSIARDLNIGKGSENVNLAVGYDNTSASGIFNCETSLTIGTSHTTNSARQMITLQRLYISDLKSFCKRSSITCKLHVIQGL